MKPPFGARLDTGSQLAKGLVSAWLFNESGGLRVFDLCGRNHGLMTNMASPSTSTSGRGFSKDGPVLVYDGTNDSVVVPHDASLAITGDMTISAWVNLRSYTNYNGIIGKTSATAISAPYDFYIVQSSGLPSIVIGNGSSFLGATGTSAVPLSAWSHVVVTMRSGGAYAFFLNGRPNGSGTIGDLRGDLGTAVYIGNRVDGFVKLAGSLDQVRLYNRVLSSYEVSELYRKPYAGIAPVLRPKRAIQRIVVPEPDNPGGFLVFM